MSCCCGAVCHDMHAVVEDPRAYVQVTPWTSPPEPLPGPPPLPPAPEPEEPEEPEEAWQAGRWVWRMPYERWFSREDPSAENTADGP